MNTYTYTIFALFTFVKFELAQETATENSVGLSVGNSSDETIHFTPSSLTDPEDNNLMKTFWIYRPEGIISPAVEDVEVYQVQLKEPILLTRLAKSWTFDYDPYFNKDYFEPFERRPKPLQILTFRKHGFIPKETFHMTPDPEIVEKQSPFNSVSQFWKDLLSNK